MLQPKLSQSCSKEAVKKCGHNFLVGRIGSTDSQTSRHPSQHVMIGIGDGLSLEFLTNCLSDIDDFAHVLKFFNKFTIVFRFLPPNSRFANVNFRRFDVDDQFAEYVAVV